ncbi:hypothetical protein SUGI_0874070 [Cryptomeria japonica]|nr:hypothetical protein SUGI_0874070 [Cryptomeria japonica]
MEEINLSMTSEDLGNTLSSLSNLREIRLSGCGILGTIPSFLNLTHLTHVDLSYNPFYSQLPDWFHNVSSLVSLHLSWFNGSIPPNFLYHSSLRILDLSDNNYMGGLIPHSFAKFSMLETLDLSNSNLTRDLALLGSFSDRLSSLGNLDLNNNQLYGIIPDTISKLSSLTYLDLSDNQFFGTIPHTISKLFSLRNLDLNNNQMSGTVPHSISKLVKLEELSLNSNNLSGNISPSILMDRAHLKIVDFSKNQLTFNISSSWIP